MTRGCPSHKMTQKCLKHWIWKPSQHTSKEKKSNEVGQYDLTRPGGISLSRIPCRIFALEKINLLTRCFGQSLYQSPQVLSKDCQSGFPGWELKVLKIPYIIYISLDRQVPRYIRLWIPGCFAPRLDGTECLRKHPLSSTKIGPCAPSAFDGAFSWRWLLIKWNVHQSKNRASLSTLVRLRRTLLCCFSWPLWDSCEFGFSYFISVIERDINPKGGILYTAWLKITRMWFSQ